MNSENGGQSTYKLPGQQDQPQNYPVTPASTDPLVRQNPHPTNDLQRQTASAIARKKVLASYTKSATQAYTNPENNASAMKNEPINPVIDSESWKRYHTAWQNYYQKYYNDYYSSAAQNYLVTERQKDATKVAEAQRAAYQAGQQSVQANPAVTQDDSAKIEHKLRKKIRQKATDSARKTHRYRKIIPIIAGVFVTLLILFLQYNRLIFAPIMAYMTPGENAASEIETVDPTVVATISPEPKLLIPKLNIDVPVSFGITLNEVSAAMRVGVAHYRIIGASAYPGENGNLVIIGHSAGDVYNSDPYKFIFSGLERLEDGDLVYINYESTRYTYRIREKRVIEPTDVTALVMDTDKPMLTLVTCTPLGTSRYRLLVIGEQISPSTTAVDSNSEGAAEIDSDSTMPANEPTFFERIFGQ